MPHCGQTMRKQKLDPQLTLLDSAQCFHWRKTAHGYAAVVAGKPMFVREGEAPQDAAYFDWARDYEQMAARYAQFPALQRWMEELRGLRVLRQPVWEALVAFILSSNNNAVRIRQLVWKVCALGPQMEIDGAPMRGFPAPEVLARAGADALRQMGCGYRAEYLEQTARRVADGFGLEALRALEYGAARERLLQLSGVGPKVADCVLLFGCGHTQAFPVDVWMARAMEKYFGMGGLSRERMREGAQEIFGSDAGLVQQFIFHAMRTGLA